MQFLKNLESKGVLQSSSVENQTQFKLQRPTKIFITKNVIDKIKEIYRPDYENGGLLIGKFTNGIILIDNIRVIKNQSLSKSEYTPSVKEWRKELQSIIWGELLPFAFHTHPTNLGIEYYDTSKPNFFIRSSQPDREVAKQGFDFQDVELFMPECIFVVDSRYENGINLNMYEGGILPPSVGRLGTVEIVTAVAGGVILIYKLLFQKYKYLFLLMAVIMLVFLFEWYRRPTYDFKNEGIEVVFV